jgi:hypothetical protein
MTQTDPEPSHGEVLVAVNPSRHADNRSRRVKEYHDLINFDYFRWEAVGDKISMPNTSVNYNEKFGQKTCSPHETLFRNSCAKNSKAELISLPHETLHMPAKYAMKGKKERIHPPSTTIPTKMLICVL